MILRIAIWLALFSPIFVIGQDFKERQAEALRLLEDFKNDSVNSEIFDFPKDTFVSHLEKIILEPISVNQTNMTNFCGKAAPFCFLGMAYEPDKMTEFLIDLFVKGKSTFRNCRKEIEVEIPSEYYKEINLEVKGMHDGYTRLDTLTINAGFALFSYALTFKYTSKLNRGRKYKRGDENDLWGATTMGIEKKVVRDFFGLNFRSFGSNFLLDPFKGTLKKRLDFKDNEYVFLLVNGRKLHRQKMRHKGIGTHWIVLKEVFVQDGKQMAQWWEYGEIYEDEFEVLDEALSGGVIISMPKKCEAWDEIRTPVFRKFGKGNEKKDSE